MKVLKWIVGIIALVAFFLWIDSTLINRKSHIESLKSWANGETKKLHFDVAGK